MEIGKYIIDEKASIIETMQKIEKGGRGIVFVCNERRLITSITDGDIRRHLIGGGKLIQNIMEIHTAPTVSIYCEERKDAVKLMKEHLITAIPVVDREMNIISIEFLIYKKEVEKKQIGVPIVIMAGGKGLRLKPYTDILPKPLIPIANKTITEHIFERFEEYGCVNKYMIVNYKKEFIKAYYRENESHQNVHFIEEKTYFGTGGGIKLIENVIASDDIFLSNCDILIEADYSEIYEYHKKQSNLITMVCAKKMITIPYGVIEKTENNEVEKIIEKPQETYLVNTGLYVINRKFLEYIPEDTFIHITDVIQDCLNKKEKVGAFLLEDEQWMDMGELEELEKTKEKLELM